MSLSGKEYEKMTKKASPPSPKILNLIKAFAIGGLICVIGEGFSKFYESMGVKEKTITSLVPCTIIIIAAILTALGVFDKIARHAGAGTIVPITGFANSIVSPAMEFQSEGRILGTGANMFKIAGPVIVYGSAAAVIYGAIYYVVQVLL
ncbi:MAG: stage V sporulation protein AC [Clostridia bacterium]|nr:stage V sporulation protein AC [Clostridia bacterium]